MTIISQFAGFNLSGAVIQGIQNQLSSGVLDTAEFSRFEVTAFSQSREPLQGLMWQASALPERPYLVLNQNITATPLSIPELELRLAPTVISLLTYVEEETEVADGSPALRAQADTLVRLDALFSPHPLSLYDEKNEALDALITDDAKEQLLKDFITGCPTLEAVGNVLSGYMFAWPFADNDYLSTRAQANALYLLRRMGYHYLPAYIEKLVPSDLKAENNAEKYMDLTDLDRN